MPSTSPKERKRTRTSPLKDTGTRCTGILEQCLHGLGALRTHQALHRAHNLVLARIAPKNESRHRDRNQEEGS